MDCPRPFVIILTGPRQGGKSSLLFALLHYLRKERLTVAGIIAEGLWENGVRSGFNLLDVADNVFTPLCRRDAEGGSRGETPYDFRGEGIGAGRRALSVERCAAADVVLVDEVGPLEIRGGGWAPSISPLLKLYGPVHLWVVRDTCLYEVRRIWGLVEAEVVDIRESDAVGRLVQLCQRYARMGKATAI